MTTGGPLAHVVLHEPEIPNNTGTIGRTCVALGARLHLIRPLGFDLGERALRRAGLDYWPRLDWCEHASFEAYLEAERPGERLWLLTAHRGVPAFEAPWRRGDHLVFGKETAGLPEAVVEPYAARCVRYPMRPGERSLNLAVVAGAALLDLAGRLHRAGELPLGPGGDLA